MPVDVVIQQEPNRTERTERDDVDDLDRQALGYRNTNGETRGIVYRSLRLYAQSSTYLATFHFLANLVVGVLTFTLAVTAISVSASLSIFVFGLPLLMLTVFMGRLIGRLERSRAHVFLGVDDELPQALVWEGASWQARLRSSVTDPFGWKGLIYSLIMLPWGIFTFTLTVVMWTVMPAFLTYPLYGWAIGTTFDSHSLVGLTRLGFSFAVGLVGLLLVALVPWLMQLLAAANRGIVRSLLCAPNNAILQARIVELTQTRTASVASADETLRRIERDLHDGAQQRLVALALDLGLAKERLRSGETPDRVLELVDRAHEEAKQSIVELRELVRGIHPAVLSDRGLDAALSALAARSPIPVTVQVSPMDRPPAHLEATAYFVVAEALTNLAKHSGATRGSIKVDRSFSAISAISAVSAAGSVSSALLVTITDNGRGGALVIPRGGLAGMVDRVKAVDGTLDISSPVGGPTTIEVRLPCAW
jgi:signal transduction histidine kinase